MPGIAGIINKLPREKNEKELDLMIGCMMHENFYKSSTYINQKLGIYIGGVAAIDSFSDCMPIFNERKDMVLLFWGENFVDEEVFIRLKHNGHTFDNSNASYLIHLYEDEGEEKFLQHLNGFFNGILVDLRKPKVILFNDRYGMQRIYFHESKENFLFSSEAKSILKVRPELREINYKSLGEFFSCGCVLENRTLFHDIFLLPGGAAWSFDNGKTIRKESYFSPDVWENQSAIGKEIFFKKLKETFVNILPPYFSSNGPIAFSLTGGLDTRMILACRENLPGTLPCYTHGGIYRDSFDVKFARKVANACQQSHQVLTVGKEFLSDFPKQAAKTVYISDGNLDVTQSVGLYTNKIARDFASARMTGNYGSEVLRGAVMFKPSSPCELLFHSDFIKHIEHTKNTYANIKAGHPVSFIVFKQAPWHLYNRLSVEQSQLTQRSPYMDNDLVNLVFQAPKEAITGNEISLRFISNFNPALAEITTDRGVGGQANPFVSICARAYYEFLFKMDYYYNHGMPQWLAKLDHAFSFLKMEKVFLGRHKYNHFRVWFRDELSSYVKEILLDKRTADRPYLNAKFLEKMVNGHITGDQNYTNEIGMVLTTELLHRLLIEQV
ncbi:MAG TPA: hypothetical protein PKZ42_10325 [Syntrophales bacterium]|nr:hypothetical protein [Syntrophales bacterium]